MSQRKRCRAGPRRIAPAYRRAHRLRAGRRLGLLSPSRRLREELERRSTNADPLDPGASRRRPNPGRRPVVPCSFWNAVREALRRAPRADSARRAGRAALEAASARTGQGRGTRHYDSPLFLLDERRTVRSATATPCRPRRNDNDAPRSSTSAQSPAGSHSPVPPATARRGAGIGRQLLLDFRSTGRLAGPVA